MERIGLDWKGTFEKCEWLTVWLSEWGKTWLLAWLSPLKTPSALCSTQNSSKLIMRITSVSLRRRMTRLKLWVLVHQALGTRSFKIRIRSFKAFLGHVFFSSRGLLGGSKMSEFGPRGEGGQLFKRNVWIIWVVQNFWVFLFDASPYVKLQILIEYNCERWYQWRKS